MSIPEGATHKGELGRYYKCVQGEWFYANHFGHWRKYYSGRPFSLKSLAQPKPWSGPEDGLPPVGLECEVDHGNGKHWDKVTIVAHHCEKAIYLDPVRGIHYIWGLVKDFRTVRTPDQIASDARETAIRELMDIAQVDCRVTAARLVDAGFKREVA